MQKRVILIILLILVFASSVFIFNLTSIPVLSNLAQAIMAPPKSLLYGIKAGSIESENKFKTENEELRQKLIDQERLTRDNLALRDQFESGMTNEFKLLPARVIGSQGSFSRPSILIVDQGRKSGVAPGMAVVLKNNLLGKVETVSDNYSKIILTQNEKFATLARTSETNALGVARGTGDFILLDQVSINDSLSKDQMLLTRGEINEKGIGIPPDFIIGKISSVNKNESLPTQSAKVENIIDASRIDMVFVIISP
jgi:rod shape-determining protein MreC